MKDTARVLGRMYDAIEFRGFSQQSAQELAAYSGVPVYNGLTDEAHPTQALADFMTMREFTHKHLSDMAVVFMGDVGNNVARSLALGAVKLGMDMRLCGPRDLWPDEDFASKLLEHCVGDERKASSVRRPRRGRCRAPILSTRTCGCRWASPRRNGRNVSVC